MKQIIIILTVGMAVMLSNIDASIVLIAMPTMEQYFNVGTADVSLIVMAYLLIICCTSQIFGRLADIIGTKKIFITGYTLFTLGSVFCALSPTLTLLICARMFQALGGAMLLSTYCAIVTVNIPEEMRGRAFGFVSVLASIGFAAGAPLGGIILHHADWHWLFLINIPIGIVGIVLAAITLKPATEQNSHGVTFDYYGALLSFLWLAPLVYTLATVQDVGWRSPQTLILLAITAVALPLFAIVELKTRHPLFDFSLFNARPFVFAIAAAFIVLMVQVGLIFVFPFFFQYAQGKTVTLTGQILMIFPVVIILFSPLAGYLTDKINPRIISVSALFLLICTCGILLFFSESTDETMIITALVLLGVAMAMFFTSNITLVMSYAKEGQEGVLSGFMAVIASLGALLGIAAFQIAYSWGLPQISSATLDPGLIVRSFNHSIMLAICFAIIAFFAACWGRKKKTAGSKEVVR
jgi:EmrB/QacA subfamily drug resistance transporter